MNRIEKVFVIAGNATQFKNFRKKLEEKMIKEGVSFHHQDIVYIDVPERLRGHRNIHGYKVGTWRERRDLYEIELQLQITDSFDNFIEIDESFYDV